MTKRLIVSLFDFSGEWSRPYRGAGYDVLQIDIKLDTDVMTYTHPRRPWGVLAAPPCTIWTNVAAWMWPAVTPEVYAYHRRLVLRTWALCNEAESFWAMENPAGRLGTIIGPHSYVFQPHHFGDPWSKRTWLWGNFHPPEKTPCVSNGALVDGNNSGKRRHETLFGTSHASTEKFIGQYKSPAATEARRTRRSTTPAGFAKAFFLANP